MANANTLPQTNAPEHSLYVRSFRAIARPVFRMLFRLLARPMIKGLENVPAHGPYLVTANHLGVADPPLVLAFWPYPMEALGAANMMTQHIYGFIMRGYGTYPVHRGAFDLAVVRKAREILAAGLPLFIAPEGGRSPAGLREARPGAAYLAVKAGAPIVPVGITGTARMFATLRRGRRESIVMRVGEPYELPATQLSGHNRKQVLQEYTSEIMRRIAALLPREYQGIYATDV